MFQVSAEFQRITTRDLEPKFMSMLDLYSPKLLSLFQAKKGAAGERHRAQTSTSGTTIVFPLEWSEPEEADFFSDYLSHVILLGI